MDRGSEMAEVTGMGKKLGILSKERRSSYGNVEELLRKKRDRQKEEVEGGRGNI